jgi:hypothetical protein
MMTSLSERLPASESARCGLSCRPPCEASLYIKAASPGPRFEFARARDSIPLGPCSISRSDETHCRRGK